MHQQVPCTCQKMISFRSRLIACCKLAPTLARQMWRHNYVIDGNEYLIFTLLESINPWVYSQQFLFKSTNNSWRYERKCEWVFFSEHSVFTHTWCIHWLTAFDWLKLLQQSASRLGIDQNLQRHRAVSLRQHGFLVCFMHTGMLRNWEVGL